MIRSAPAGHNNGTHAITRKSLADEIDTYDQSIADLNQGKKDCFDAYREQMVAAGVAKENVRKEIDAVKAAIRRRRAVEKDEIAVEEKDALVDEVFAEITARTRAPRATRIREEGDVSYRQLRSEDMRALAQDRAAVDWDDVMRREFPDDTSVHVYFVEAPDLGLIKIGSSGNVEQRIAALIRNGPAELTRIGVISGGPKLELELHQRFARHRVRGEWFHNDIRPDIDALIAQCIEKFPAPPLSAAPGGEPSIPSSDAGREERVGASPPTQEWASEEEGSDQAQSERAADQFEPVAFLRQAKPIRPHCLHPGDSCGGYGSKHCNPCLKAAGEVAA